MRNFVIWTAILMSAQALNAQPYKNFHGVSVRGSHIWVVAKDTSRSNVYYSPDFGETWEERGFTIHTGFYVPLFDVEFVDRYTGWVVGMEGYIYRTDDGGLTWTQQVYGVSKFVTRAKFLNSMVGWAACGDAIYARTSSGGNPPPNGWTAGPTIPYATELYGVAPFDSLEAFYAAGDPINRGGQGFLIYTMDGGTSWQIIIQDSVYDYFDVFFVDYDNGWLVGGTDTLPYEPKIYCTDTHGAVWDDCTPQLGHTLRAVYFVDQNEGWAVGELGTILHTTDGGATWELQNSGVTSTLFDVEFSDNLHGVVVGDSNVVLITTDGGATWVPIHPENVAEDDGGRPIETVPSNFRTIVATRQLEIPIRSSSKVEIFESNGQRLLSTTASPPKFEIELPHNGVFFIRISDGKAANYLRVIVF